MNRFWKWTLAILGILIVLAIVAIPFAMHSVFGFSIARGFDGWNGPMMRDHHGLGFDRFHGPLMYGRGFGPWGAFSFFGGLVKLAFFGALLYGAYWLLLWSYPLSERARYNTTPRQVIIVLGVVPGALIFHEGAPVLRATAAIILTLGIILIVLGG